MSLVENFCISLSPGSRALYLLPGLYLGGKYKALHPPSSNTKEKKYMTTNAQGVLEMECLSQSVFYDYLKTLGIYFQVGCAVETSNKFSYTLD